jgi:enoyl-CoA hydratase/carnithine racemase
MIALHHADGIATIALDRPEARNAMPTAAWLDLAATVAQIPANARVVVIASTTPGIFSAGADLKDLARLAEDVPARAAFRDAMRAGIEAVAGLSMPTLAAVEGGCFGAAVALALACDLVVAGPDARFAVPPAKLGIAYPAPDVARLTARVGQGAARRLLFTADTIDAGEALRIGLADMIDLPGDVAARIAGNDPAATALLKRMAADPHAPGQAAAFADSFASPAFAAATARYRTTP